MSGYTTLRSNPRSVTGWLDIAGRFPVRRRGPLPNESLGNLDGEGSGRANLPAKRSPTARDFRNAFDRDGVPSRSPHDPSRTYGRPAYGAGVCP
jgi:hypothetical protein